MALIFESQISTKYGAIAISQIKTVASTLKINPDWLIMVMYIETAGTFSTKIQNTSYRFTDCGGGYATGIIQFTPCTAVNLGTSVDALYKMMFTDQLYYVNKYYKNLGMIGRMNSFYDVYLATFFPAGVGKPDDWVLETSTISAGAVARANSGIDLNKDGKITIAEFKLWALSKVPASLYQQVFGTNDPRSLIQTPVQTTSPQIANVATQTTNQPVQQTTQAGSSLLWVLLLGTAGLGFYLQNNRKKKKK